MPFAGIDDLSRSHFATQDAIEFGQPAEVARDFQSGFMNRLAAIVARFAAAAPSERADLLLEYARTFPALPAGGGGPMEPVPECAVPLFVKVEIEGKTFAQGG